MTDLRAGERFGGRNFYAYRSLARYDSEKVDDIGPARRRKIEAAWSEQKAGRDITFLHSYRAPARKTVASRSRV